jgi:hypothetical protein
MMSSSLRDHGHECHTIFLKRYGRSSVVDAEPDDYPWIGIDSRGREFRYAHGSLLGSTSGCRVLLHFANFRPWVSSDL